MAQDEAQHLSADSSHDPLLVLSAGEQSWVAHEGLY
jgi:hypothetical protein